MYTSEAGALELPVPACFGDSLPLLYFFPQALHSRTKPVAVGHPFLHVHVWMTPHSGLAHRVPETAAALLTLPGFEPSEALLLPTFVCLCALEQSRTGRVSC